MTADCDQPFRLNRRGAGQVSTGVLPAPTFDGSLGLPIMIRSLFRLIGVIFLAAGFILADV